MGKMSIKVENLSKRYATQTAVDHISFQANSGRILGFLGPNGAGKSTTMKIITGYLKADGGKVYVDNLDIEQHAIEAKRLTGYLPENTPLYVEMYVREFLHFVGQTYQLNDLNTTVEAVIKQVGLEREQNKKIAELSKGYKQRVGLAQAIMHNPAVLILDEPTAGLDPNQLVDIRALIKNLGTNRTVIISTHIMQEVEAICDDVLIINRGKIVAHESLTSLKAKHAGKSMEDIFKALTA
jgi:ABC-2 type transport system ATP-binding protein